MKAKILINGVIGWDVTAESVKDQLKEAGGKPIEVEISSPGGSVFEGIAIYNLIKGYKGEKETKIIGLAASMGSYIALATDKVSAAENAVYMIHNASVFALGDHNDLRKAANTLEGLSNILAKKYQSKTGKSAEEITSLMDEESWFFGEEIQEAGFVDEIFEVEEKEDKAEAVALARLTFEECEAKLKSETKSDELEKVAALLQKPPVKAEHQKPEKKDEMSPEEIKALQEENAKLKAEAAAKAEAEPQQDHKQDPNVEESTIDLAAKILASSEYPQSVKDVATKALKGKESAESLAMMVATADMIAESKKSTQAADETKDLGDTPAVQGEDEEKKSFKASVEAAKAALGKKGEVK